MTKAIDGKTAGSPDAAEQTLFSKLAQRRREARENRVQMHLPPDLQRRIALLAEQDGLVLQRLVHARAGAGRQAG